MYQINILKISGKDSKEFLQSIITNDIKQNGSFYSLILSPNGRYLFDFFITEKNSDYYIEIDEKQSVSFIEKLNQIKFRKDFIIEDLSQTYSFLYSKTPIDNSFITYNDTRFSMLGYRNILLKERLNNYENDLYIMDKFEYAIPDGSFDLKKEKSFPQEFGLDILNAISFKKGCYVGQEVVSRIKTQGIIRKKIFKVIAENDLSNISDFEIFFEDTHVGNITSFKKNIGIAQIFLSDDFNINSNFKVEDIKIKIELPKWAF